MPNNADLMSACPGAAIARLAAWENEGGAWDENADDARRPATPAHRAIPLYLNDLGVVSIRIGVQELHCIGARPPHDHPHVYLNMGDRSEILCPYCSTRFVYAPSLRWNDTEPAGCCFGLGWGEQTGAVPVLVPRT
jgi:uncharacterized Zn-finger protein